MIKNRKLLLAITISVILSSVFLQGCVTDKMRAKICSECHPVSDSTSSKIKETITKHDSDFNIEAKNGPDIYITYAEADDSSSSSSSNDSSDCEKLKREIAYLKDHPIIKTVNGITTTVKSDGKKISISTNEEAWKLHVKNARIERDLYKEEFEKLLYKEVCQLRHHNTYDQVCDFGFPIILFLIALYLYIRIRYRPR